MTHCRNSDDRGRARVRAVLRYRGMDAEALTVTRLINVEMLVDSIESVLDDLWSALGRQSDCSGVTVAEALRRHIRQAYGGGLVDAPLRQLRLVESILEAALSQARKSHEFVCAYDRGQVRDNGGHDASTDGGAARRGNGKRRPVIDECERWANRFATGSTDG